MPFRLLRQYYCIRHRDELMIQHEKLGTFSPDA